MNLTNLQLIKIVNSLKNLVNQSLPVKTSYNLMYDIDKINANLKIYDKEKNKILQKYGKKNEHDKLVVKSDQTVVFNSIEDENKCKKDITDLLNISIDVDLRKIKITEFGDATLSVNQVNDLMYIIDA